uniref:tRNA (guanine(37)-N1)-methyltransferase n=1 Tax=Odontella aurita TaxID=265563 RepID=A0A7S4JH19_9STRA|mmetsp:Transcript_46414/g.140561  ORF Transcript_46414/g.140561 Transcript_46414/m.140561 type:complete len:653 (+) Transcript_46414:50-2008(+)
MAGNGEPPLAQPPSLANSGAADSPLPLPLPKPLALPLPAPSSLTSSAAARAYAPSLLHSRLLPMFDETTVHPALIVPARRTAELRKKLGHVLMRRPRMCDVYKLTPEEEADAAAAAAAEGSARAEERKLALILKLDPPVPVPAAAAAGRDGTTITDDVYSDPAIASLLSECGDGGDGGSPFPAVRRSTHSIALAYGHLTVDRILRRILPPSVREVPSSFEAIGRLAHVNLREEALPYRYLIGRAVLDRNVGLDVVVNKIGTIENEYRTFPMEVLARRPLARKVDVGGDAGADDAAEKDAVMREPRGDDLELEVEVREEGCRFLLDFARVYWNSRLAGEHRRLVRLVAGKQPGREKALNRKQQKARKKIKDRKGKKRKLEEKDGTMGNTTDDGGNDGNGANGIANADASVGNASGERGPPAASPLPTVSLPRIVVADAMAGVGPFSVPLTSRYNAVTCHANDLNPTSYRYLTENAERNKCSSLDLLTYNMDGRAFLRRLDEEGVALDHVLMNLPASAPEFLDAFRGYSFPHKTRAVVARADEARAAQKEDGAAAGKEDEEAAAIPAAITTETSESSRRHRPVVHVHCFGPKDTKEAEKEAVGRCETALGCQLDGDTDQVKVHVVRDVSPRKNMLCVSFKLPWGVRELEKADFS